MLVGNLGSRYRFAYGVLGDQVNLGSRLEGLNKMYRTDIIIGENTAMRLGGDFLLRELDRVRVKGKKKPVTIYELLGHAAEGLTAEKERAYGFYAAAMEAYWHGRWEEAAGLYERCMGILPDDGPSPVMSARCRLYMETPPGEGWDGVFEHLSK
jgi:adenylate cyclase